MPPSVPRKRLREDGAKPSPEAVSPSAPIKATTPRKRTLFDDLDAADTPGPPSSDVPHVDSSSDDELTDLSDIDFDDVPLAKRQKTDEAAGDDDDDDDDEDEDIEFEDVALQAAPVPVPSGDLELTLRRDNRISLTASFGKKGPSKLERKIRVATHSVHVLLLLWHNTVRNAWLCDQEVQAIMISHIPPRLWDEIDRWRRSSGLDKARPEIKGNKRKGKEQASKTRGSAASKLEEAATDTGHGDPLFRLMQSLVGWWKQRFNVSAPGIRKWGYMSLERLDRLTKAYKGGGGGDPSKFGERVPDLETFRLCAQRCEGSRDIGAQLFTALLRGLGMDARMVASLQPLGFGWNKLEDADPEKQSEGSQFVPTDGAVEAVKESPERLPSPASKPLKFTRPVRRAAKNGRKRPVDDSDDEPLSEPPDSEDSSDIEMSEIARQNVVSKGYDKDLDFPHYWTEVRSPVTNKYVPVDAIVKKIVGNSRELIESLEPRGGKAEKRRQVMAYIVGYSQDGTAKDVTVRYLKRQMLPGKTKGVRMPLRKIPVYNRHGKVKRHDDYDWFKHAIAGYLRGSEKTPLTEADQLEDATDLTPAKIEKKEIKEGEETLQYYKTSQEYVLQRHLKREEALQPDAKPVKIFKAKSKGKVTEEPVYLRSDVVHVKSAETWHKQGRAPVPGAVPLKRAPYRAATINRLRELAEAEAATGEKALQGLYSMDQTDWIIPPPIKDGIIPKNSYGNIDLFVEHMCPEGAVHIPYRGSVRVCKRLQIDYAEAVVDFEFGHRMAVPVIQGVVIAEEYYDKVMEELAKDEAERTRKEDEKRRKAALGMWRKLLMGMRIAQRIREEYGEIDGSVQVFGQHRDKFPTSEAGTSGGQQGGHGDAEMAGGFLPDGYEEEEEEEEGEGGGRSGRTSSFFPPMDDEDDDGIDSLVVQDDRVLEQAPPDTEMEEVATEAEIKLTAKAGGRRAQNKSTTKTSGRRSGTRQTRARRKADLEDAEESAEELVALGGDQGVKSGGREYYEVPDSDEGDAFEDGDEDYVE